MALSVIALVVSAAAFAITIWDKLLRRADLGAQVDWLLGDEGGRALRVALLNKGWRKDCVREARFFVADVEHPYTPWMLDRLPMVLDIDEASAPLWLHAGVQEPAQDNPFQKALRSGQGTKHFEIENIRGRTTRFEVPPVE